MDYLILIFIILMVANGLYLLWSDRKFWKKQNDTWDKLKYLEWQSERFYEDLKEINIDE